MSLKLATSQDGAVLGITDSFKICPSEAAAVLPRKETELKREHPGTPVRTCFNWGLLCPSSAWEIKSWWKLKDTQRCEGGRT